MTAVINFKMIVLGEQGVGKSCMVRRYIKGDFADHYNVTVGVEYSSQSVEIDLQNTVRLQIWDTAGQELFRSVVRSFYKGISAVFLVFGIDNRSSFDALANWNRQIRENAHEEVVVFLVGARADLEQGRLVSAEAAQQFMKDIGGAFYVETSAKSGLNVSTLFQKAAKILHKKYVSNNAFRTLVRPVLASRVSERSQSIRISKEPTIDKPKKKCC